MSKCPKNDLRTKGMSNKPTISSENEIEKCYLWHKNSAAFQKRLSTINSVFWFLDGTGGVESMADSTLHLLKEILQLRQIETLNSKTNPTFLRQFYANFNYLLINHNQWRGPLKNKSGRL